MRKEKYARRRKRTKRQILFLIASFVAVIGLYLTTTNGYKLLNGYLLFKWNHLTSDEKPLYKETAVAAEKKEEDVLYDTRPQKGEKIGVLKIPKLNAELPIYHGTDEDELEKGVGHYSGSVLPGENDNSVLSGHRDTVFRRLGEVGESDILVVETKAGMFTYKVRKVRIVDANDRTVIVPKPRATLTVSTCYPFDFIGAAPERYVLVANLVEKS